MTLPSRNSLDTFPLLWLRMLGATCGKCWNLMPSDPARVLGAAQWYWCGRRTAGLWFCIDFCWLNACMKKDSYPLPRIQEALESLVGAGHFSCLDLKSGFWQIKMEEASKQYTTFTVGNLGFFKCDCMPFGLCNALVTFQWLMQNWLGKLNLIYCLIYLDNLIVFLQTAKEHLHQLCVMFE